MIDDAIPDKVLQGIIPAVPDNIDVHVLHETAETTAQDHAVMSVDDITGVPHTTYRDITYYSHRAACRDPTWGHYFTNALNEEVGELIRMEALKPIAYSTINAHEVIHPSTCIYTCLFRQISGQRHRLRSQVVTSSTMAHDPNAPSSLTDTRIHNVTLLD